MLLYQSDLLLRQGEWGVAKVVLDPDISAFIQKELDGIKVALAGSQTTTTARDDLKLGLGLQRDGVPIGARPALVVR